MICKFCAAEMLRLILQNQECCARRIEAKSEVLAIELIRHLQMIIERVK